MGKKKHNRISFGGTAESKGKTNSGRNFKSNQYNNQEENEEHTEIHFMQPELLPEEMMSDLLIKRGANTLLLRNKDNKFLAKLFYKHITPKPQRTYKNNRVGKLLQAKIKKVTSYNDDWGTKIFSNGTKSISICSRSAKSNKPVITFDSKTSSSSTTPKKISLNHDIADKKKVISNSSDSLSHIVIKKREPKTEVTRSEEVSCLDVDKKSNQHDSKPSIKAPTTEEEMSSHCKIVDRKKLNLKSPSLNIINKVLRGESNTESSSKRKIEEDTPRIVKLTKADPVDKIETQDAKKDTDVNTENSNKRKLEDKISSLIKFSRNYSPNTSDSDQKRTKKRSSIGWP